VTKGRGVQCVQSNNIRLVRTFEVRGKQIIFR